MSSLYFAICWFKSTYWDFLLCSSLKYPGKKFLPDSSIFNILSDILLMQSFNPYPNGSDMHFKVSFSSSRLFLESLLSNEPVSWGFYSFGKYFFTYFLKSLYQVCDSCSIWVTDSILPEILISFCFWFLKIYKYDLRGSYLYFIKETSVFLRCIICDLYQVFLAGNPVPVTLILMMVFVYVPTGITFSFLHPSCASMLWIEWFSFLFFSCCFWWSYNNIVASICQYIFVFLCYYFYLFVLLGVYIL